MKNRKRYMMSGLSPVYRILFAILLIFICVAGCLDEKSEQGRVIANEQNRGVVPVFSPAGVSQQQTSEDARNVSDAVTQTLTAELETINSALMKGTGNLAIHGMEIPHAQKILSETRNSSPYIYSPILLNHELIITGVASDEYAGIIGSDLSNQVHLQEVITLKKPVMGGLIQTVEGIPAIPISYPVIVNGTVSGVLSVLIEQKEIFSDAILMADPERRFETFIMQPDGLVIYDTDPLRINKNVSTDSFSQKHPSLTAIVHRIKNETSGTGAYEFQNDMSPDLVTKVVVWNTTGLYGGEWRIVVSRGISEA